MSDFKGDLIYIDPAGNRWRITQRQASNNPSNYYWHADLISGGNAHRTSVSARRLLIGIDKHSWENGHDGTTINGKESRSKDASAAEGSGKADGNGKRGTSGGNRKASIY